MGKKNTAHRPATPWLEYVLTRDKRRVKNTAYDPSHPKAKKSKASSSASGRGRNVMDDVFGKREDEGVDADYVKRLLNSGMIRNGGDVRVYGDLSTGETIAIHNEDQLKQSSNIRLHGASGNINDMHDRLEEMSAIVTKSDIAAMESVNAMGPDELCKDFGDDQQFIDKGMDIVAKNLSDDDITSLNDKTIRQAWATATEQYVEASIDEFPKQAKNTLGGADYPRELSGTILNGFGPGLRGELLRRKDNL